MSTDRACPTAPGATVGRRRRGKGGAGPQDPLELAVEAFNRSDAARLVAGLARSLGEPTVSIGARAGSQTEVRITVAWELSWYQWGVDVSGEVGRVTPIAKGAEQGELDGSARIWNGGAGKDGALYLGRPRRATAKRRRLRPLRSR